MTVKLDSYFDAVRAKLHRNAPHLQMNAHVKVAVRVRPLDLRERAQNDHNIVLCSENTLTLDLTRVVQGMESATFAFDHVYGEDAT